MDLISSHSPSSSVSPPISPIKVFSQPGATLPPLKSLPLWNRTGLEKSRFIRSITKDSPENTKTEIFLSHLTSKGTQTSPPSTALGNVSQHHIEHRQDGKSHVGIGNSGTGPDKKLYFLQAEHEGVLKKLHIELENLKSKNREMTFKLIMTNNALSVSPNRKDNTDQINQQGPSGKHYQTSSARKNASDAKGEPPKDETRKHTSSFKSAGSRICKEPNGKLDTRSAGCSQVERRKSHHIGKAGAQQTFGCDGETLVEGFRVAQSDPTMQAAASALITGKQYSSKDYENIIRDLKRLNAKQASELIHLKEKLLDQRGRSDESNYVSPNRLPKLDLRSASKSAKINSGTRTKHEIVTLPALRPILGTKVTSRQRKAQASHVQRQRSNKDILQKII